MGQIKLIIVLLMAVLPAAIRAQDSFLMENKPAIPGANPAEINPGCNKCGWEILSTSTEDTQVKHIKAAYYDGKYRLDIKNDDSSQTQAIIFDNTELYILNPDLKTALLYYTAEAETPMLLESIFPGIGLKKKDRVVTGEKVIDGRKCDVISYRILKRGSNMYVWGTVTEWLDKKTGRTVKVESVTDKAQLPFGGKNIISMPITQIYEAGRVKTYLFMDKGIFKVPADYKIMDMKKQYETALEQQKGVKPGSGYEVRKLTIKRPKGNK